MSPERLKGRALGAVALGCIALQFGGSVVLSSLALGVWLLALLAFQRSILRRLWLPRFWLIGLFVVVASALLLGRRDLEVAGVGVSSRGLEAGALMTIRGTFVFGLAAWASTALGGSGWLRWCRRLGLERLGAAVRVAFGLLPALQQDLREVRVSLRRENAPRRRLGRGREAAVRFVVRVARLAERLAADETSSPSGPWPRDARPAAPGSPPTPLP